MAFAILTAPVSASDVSQVRVGKSAEAITQGHVLRFASDGRLEIANSGANTTDDCDGIALSTVTAQNQQIAYLLPGAILTTSGLTAGVAYYLGGGADEGKVGLFADLDTPNLFATLVGIALSATQLKILAVVTGVQQ